MRKKLVYGLLVITLMALPFFSACDGDSSPTLTPPTIPAAATVTPTTAVQANWWDKFGEPKYGGTLLVREATLQNISFDVTSFGMGEGGAGYYETLFSQNWTLDRDIWGYNCGWTPQAYSDYCLAVSWEQTGPQTIVMKLREGVYWQDRAPVNGREFTSDDVVFTYDMALGTGHGFTEPNMMLSSGISQIERVVALDPHTIEFHLKSQSLAAMQQAIGQGGEGGLSILPPEITQVTDWTDPNQVVGTGPFIATEVALGSSMTFTRNPNYWGYDERHPENQLPYVDEVKHVSIPDTATAIAAMRTGQVDLITGYMGVPSWQQAASLKETNPEINVKFMPQPGIALDFRCDHEPFTDIKVREALQIALNLQTMADTIWGGTAYGGGEPVGLLDPLIEGYALPYGEWPAELQAEYSYRPDRAKELLAEAGYPDGFETNIVCSSSDNMDFLQAVKSYWDEIGVEMEINAMDQNQYMAMVAEGKQDQIAWGFGCGQFMSAGNALSFRTSNHRWNYTHANDTYFDDQVRQYDAAITVEEAQAISQEANLYLLEKHYSISTFTRSMCVMWSPRVKGFSGELQTVRQIAGWYRARFWIDED